MKTRAFAPFLCLALLAQRPDPLPLRVTTHLVEVNVIVRSKKAPVRDLTQNDFELFEKGKKRKIEYFAVNAAPADHPRPVTAATGSAGQSAAAGLVTNRPPDGAAPVNATVVLLDGLNTALPDQAFARRELLSFLRQIRPEDRVAVYALGSRLRVLNDFSGDARRLVAAVARFSGDNAGLTGADEVAPADTPNGLGGDKIIEDTILNLSNDLISDYTIQIRAEKTAAALEAIADHIRGIPGRKNLIWITAGFPFVVGHMGDGQSNSEDTAFDNDISGVTASKKGAGPAGGSLLMVNDRDGNPARAQKSFTPEALRATRALNEANVAVYPVDARGLTVMPKSMTAEHNFGVSHSQAVAPPRGTPTFATGVTAMQAIAVSTGGAAFRNGNDLGKAIRMAADDSEVTYTLGFYPDSAELDSQFHALKVQLRRKGIPDAEVRYRPGYMALPEGPALNQAAAIASPLMATGVGLTAGREQGDRPGSMKLVVAIEPKDISFENQHLTNNGSQWTASLDLVFAQFAADGKALATANFPIGLSLNQTQHDVVLSQGLTITKTIDLAPVADELKVMVRDRASGRIGTLILSAR